MSAVANEYVSNFGGKRKVMFVVLFLTSCFFLVLWVQFPPVLLCDFCHRSRSHLMHASVTN